MSVSELEGCLNFRDLGGHPTVDGRTVRTGCLFRSGELCSLTAADVQVLSELGIKVVVDLRSSGERESRPSAAIPGVEVLLRQTPARNSTATLEEQIAAGVLPERDDEWMAESYRNMLTRLAPEFGTLVNRAAEARHAPLLFHCAAGKDRTGLAAAILLGLIGVTDEAILHDYEQTTFSYAPRRLRAIRPLLDEHGLTEEEIRHLVEARPTAMRATLGHVRERWGGFPAYAREVLGTPPAVLRRLQQELVS